MKRILPLALVMVMAVTFAPQALAIGVYAGGSYGNAGIDVDADAENFDESDGAYKLFGGVRFLKYFLVEASYNDFGEPEDSTTAVDTSAFGVFGRFHFPIWRVELFAKAGVYKWDADVDLGALGDESLDGTELAYGIGASVKLTDLLHLRGEYETFALDDGDVDGDLDMLTLGLEFRFLGN